MTVLIMARNFEPQVDRVVSELGRRGTAVFRTDLSAFPQQLVINARLGPDGLDGELVTSQRSVQIRDIKSVWYRHPSHFVFPEGMSEPERRHAAAEARCGVGGILSSVDALWVNFPSKEADALKPRQLLVAPRCGLRIPETLITNSLEAVQEFAREVAGPLAAKNLSGAVIAEGGGLSAAFTRRLDPTSGITGQELAGVEVTAHLFQRYIDDKAFEARVTVVGSRIFGAGIHPHSEDARLDFRSDYPNLSYSRVDPPEDVRKGMLAFMKEFGLVFGAFDFAVTTAGEWIMFECNPFGQYGWLEDELNLPITSALADVLESGVAV